MPDSPARPGPPIPPALAEAPAAENAAMPGHDTKRPSLRGPYGLPFPRARVTPRGQDRPAAPRQERPGPSWPEHPDTGHGRDSGTPTRRPGPALPRAMPGLEPSTAPIASPQRIVLIALVILLVTGALWADRGRHDPVAGYGVIPQPGAMSVAALESGLDVGNLAPNFRLLGANGEIVELSDLRGQPVLLHFWTTWCLDCAVELPVMQELAVQYGDDLQVIGVDVGEPAGRIDATAERYGARYPMLLDRDEEVSLAYGVTTYPATVIIDADGVVVSIQAGTVTPGEVRNQVEAVIGGG
ncbi:MAG: redoxin domain-containing protein [Chloroflexota bacterium]|nr:redoxin domain-containing protein [Chloroflexota bacterium]